MAGFSLLSLTLLLVTIAVSNQVGSGSSIIGGADVVQNNFYWMAAIVKRSFPNVIVCGGSIIADRWVMTAAHCLPRSISPHEYKVRMGVRRLMYHPSQKDTYSIVQIHYHPRYYGKYYGDDIALLKLDRNVETGNYVSPYTKLAASNFYLTNNDTCQVAGWGRVQENEDLSAYKPLQVVQIPLVSKSTCKSKYASIRITIKPEMLCAGTVGKGVCLGDSGGSLICYSKNFGDWYLVGVVSFGQRCGQTGYPSVFTRVSSYSSFIHDTIQHN